MGGVGERKREKRYILLSQGDTIRVLWALHSSDPELNTAIWPGDKRGGRALRLKTPAPHAPPRYTEDIKHWDVKLNQVSISIYIFIDIYIYIELNIDIYRYIYSIKIFKSIVCHI